VSLPKMRLTISTASGSLPTQLLIPKVVSFAIPRGRSGQKYGVNSSD